MAESQQKTQEAARTRRFTLSDPNRSFRDRSGYHLVGDQVIEIPAGHIPPGVSQAVATGRLRETDEEPHDNTRGPMRPTTTIPRLAVHLRGRQHALIPNFDVSTERGGGTTADAGNHGPTGINSAWGKEQHGDAPSEAATLTNREIMHQQYGMIMDSAQAEDLLRQALEREARLEAELGAARAAMEHGNDAARAIQGSAGSGTGRGARKAASALAEDTRTALAAEADDQAGHAQAVKESAVTGQGESPGESPATEAP